MVITKVDTKVGTHPHKNENCSGSKLFANEHYIRIKSEKVGGKGIAFKVL